MKFMNREIKFGIEATTKSEILKKVKEVKEQKVDTLSELESMLKIVPEMLLVGLQKKYRDEFRYDYNTGEGKDDAMSKVYDLIDDYTEQKDSSIGDLFNDLVSELVMNGFFKKEAAEAKTAAKEQEKAAKTEK